MMRIPLLIDPYALSSDKTVPFFKGLRLTVKYGPYMKLTASFLLISTAVQVIVVCKRSCLNLACIHPTREPLSMSIQTLQDIQEAVNHWVKVEIVAFSLEYTGSEIMLQLYI